MSCCCFSKLQGATTKAGIMSDEMPQTAKVQSAAKARDDEQRR
eukprot:CAMPEP_0172864014 /NCGR_PEP_ID=MMETSP1075-20121228/79087_1 /TAXON_ID=2916 /ORGANISM="Ceratium fusus, Strain PA161109" /LENGTH=42 /DNA_ID= /DNA_START= /DNA_END= /DNA_ORIENTATION=